MSFNEIAHENESCMTFQLGLQPLGAHPRGGPGGPGPSPWDLENTRFSVCLPLSYVSFVLATCVLKLFALRKDRESRKHGKELT